MSDSGSSGTAGGSAPVSIVFFIALCFLVGVLCRRYLQILFVPVPVLLYAFGIAIAQFIWVSGDVSEALGLSMARMNPHLVLTVFLPILIYDGATQIHLPALRHVQNQVALLAGPGCLVMALLMALLTQQLYRDWSLLEAALLGAILCATDTVSVTAILYEVGADVRITTLVEGESLFNDASAIVLFEFIEAAIMHEQIVSTFSEMARRVVILLLGGIALGWALGRVVAVIIRHTFNDPYIEVTLTLSGAVLSYYISDQLIDSRGQPRGGAVPEALLECRCVSG
eukprot:RCo024866